MKCCSMSCWSNHTAVFIISIGSSRIQSVAAASDAIIYAAAQQFPDYELREVFLHRKTDTQTDPLQAALEQAVSDGIRTLVVQPAFLMYGYEYKKLEKVLGQYREKFRQIVLGEPLLAGEADFKAVRNAAAGQCVDYKDGKTAVCFVGHGGEAGVGSIYIKMQQMFTEAGYKDFFIGTIKGEPSLENIKKALRAGGSYRTVVLRPFMTAAGNHAYRDLAGEQDGSWKRALEQEGYQVVCVMEGLGQIPAVQEIFAAHIRSAVERL